MDIKTELPIKVTVEADSAYANICWIAVNGDDSECFGAVEETFCEPIYIGLNPSCETEKISGGTFPWSGKTISYVITQLPRTDCDPCPTSNWCELIDMYVSPYYIPYSADSTSNVYYTYWQYNEADCEITRHKVSGSAICTFTASETNKPCSADSRVITSAITIGCGSETKDIDFYVKMPDTCCDKPSGICYEIGDVIYVDSSGSSGAQITEVEHSGGTIYFYFDYKMIDTDDKCNSKITYGRSKRIPWTIPDCAEGETASTIVVDVNDHVELTPQCGCCSDSAITSSYTWDNHTSCINGGSVMNVPLNIVRKRDYTRDDCRNVCKPSTSYCIVSPISAYTMDGNELPTNHIFPSYGGKVKLRWMYDTYECHDDCTSTYTSGNTWEDIVTIPPYTGECVSGSESTIVVNYNDIPSSGITIKPAEDCIESGNVISYKFKEIGDCKSYNCNNIVEFTYNQYKTICKETCTNCFSADVITFDASGGTYQLSANTECKGKEVFFELPWWVKLVDDDLLDDSIIGLSVEKTDYTREDVITIYIGNCTDDIIVRQDGKHNCNIITPPNITVGKEVQFRIQ